MKPFEQTPALIDMAPTLVAALDAPTAVKPSGRVLHEIVAPPKAGINEQPVEFDYVHLREEALA